MSKQAIKKFFKSALVIFLVLIPLGGGLFLLTIPGIDENQMGQDLSTVPILKYVLVALVWLPFILTAYVGPIFGSFWIILYFLMLLICYFLYSCLLLIIFILFWKLWMKMKVYLRN